MKTILFSILLLFPFFAFAQPGINTRIAGDDYGLTCANAAGYAKSMPTPVVNGIVMDKKGNIYFSSCSNVYKIDTTGFMTIYAGNSGIAGYSGDGGPATAASLSYPYGLVFDKIGNLYICDNGNSRVRKVDTLGIITTFAGNGASVPDTGNGGPATAASISQPNGIAIDTSGNIYFAENASVKKVDVSGIITTFAGVDGDAGGPSSGDGVPATDATFTWPWGVATDRRGNVFVSDYWGNFVKRIDAAGIIHNFAGGTSTSCGDNVSALSVGIGQPYFICTDSIGNVYIAEQTNNSIRKVDTFGIITTIALGAEEGCALVAQTVNLNFQPKCPFMSPNGDLYLGTDRDIQKVSFTPFACVDSFCVFIDKQCSGPYIGVSANSHLSTLSAKTYFGDGQTDSSWLGISARYRYWFLSHAYAAPGTYTIKHIFYNSGTPVDSLSYSYGFGICKTISAQVYNDVNGNCLFDATDTHNFTPLMIQVDSNGVTIDSIPLTSGINYTALGDTGTIYSFRLLHLPPYLSVTCPASGILYDTLNASLAAMPTNYFGLTCSTSSDFDLGVHAASMAGRHAEGTDIIVTNTYCASLDGLVTMHFSPQYVYVSADPLPTSVSANTIKWNLPSLFATSPESHIHVSLGVPGAWLLPGDTVNSDYLITPTAGDLDTTNNYCHHTDTVTSAYDPNEMAVTPMGHIFSGTQLQYAIQFENTGNAPAHNISVLDTLSPYLDPSTFNIIAASAVMNINMTHDGTNNIIKFDFPGINLPDSSHHDQCTGLVIFTIKTRTGLPDGTLIPNWAGIFFDDNPVVTTDTVVNIIGFPSLSTSQVKPNITRVYPNPANDLLTIQTDHQEYQTYTISNTLGEIVARGSLNGDRTQISIKSLPANAYFVRLVGSAGSIVMRVVKM